MKPILSTIALLLAASATSHANEWHRMAGLTKAQAQSSSYRFLAKTFGPSHLLMKCDPEEASEVGDEYLIQVMDDYNDGTAHGETIGNGRTLQEALDSAAGNYMSGPRVKRIEAEEAQEEKDRRRREEIYRKRCCKP